MATKFQTRLDHVAKRMNTVNGETVSIRRGTTTTAGLLACPVLMEAEEYAENQIATRVDLQVWAFDKNQYKVGSAEVEPQLGDVIIRADGTEYRVVSEGGDAPAYRYTTSDRKRMLVFTERVK